MGNYVGHKLIFTYIRSLLTVWLHLLAERGRVIGTF